eukprot:TRINITY_DN67243_c0_g1_i1.p1 TRINITY_DN67243_c0_g1~~TRINITY_DN67243_c0_g1_i1.p1  ORF type:complete len:2048 (-),score=333.28 TRINITY_DN67243_c0_g1_i1:102-6245(-)
MVAWANTIAGSPARRRPCSQDLDFGDAMADSQAADTWTRLRFPPHKQDGRHRRLLLRLAPSRVHGACIRAAGKLHMLQLWLCILLPVVLRHGADAVDVEASMEKYSVKSCKYSLLPSSLSSRAHTTAPGEVHVNDVYGMVSTVKRHIMQVSLKGSALLTLQAEVHRDTPATLTVDVFRRGYSVHTGSDRGGRLLMGKQLLGTGGEDAKVFLHGRVSDRDQDLDIVFELSTVEVAKSQVDNTVSEARCWPVRLDITIIPEARAALHLPVTCPSRSILPNRLSAPDGGSIYTLADDGVSLPPTAGKSHFTYRFGSERNNFNGFGESLWDTIIEVQPRLHRFVRFFFRTSFRFASGPLQLVIELFDLKDTPDGTALAPTCQMGCLGGVPVYNGQLIDHAMPTGFRYRIWVLRADMGEWSVVGPQQDHQCLEFDMDYSVNFEQGLTPFEVGPAAWLCAATRLPVKIVQAADGRAWKEHVNGQLIVGRSIWVRDRFGFPPHEVADMEHKVQVEISEPVIFRATTHHSDGVDVFIILTKRDSSKRICKATKHPGPVPRQSIFCYLEPGSYDLTFFADYPLGGLHPCGEFFAQVAVRPVALQDQDQTRQCLSTQSDMTKLLVQSSFQLATTPQWKSIKVPIRFSETAGTVSVWRNLVEVTEDQALKKPYLRLVVHSDYVTSDLRFQVKFGGKYVADTQVTAHGYADMIGPLDSGSYDVEMYYISGTGGPEGLRLCSNSMVDLRLVSRTAYEDASISWMCTSIRVPPPDALSPLPDEQVLIDSEYVIPDSGLHMVRVKVTERRLIRVVALSQDATFKLSVRALGTTDSIVVGTDNIQVSVSPGSYVVKLVATLRPGVVNKCSTFVLNMLVHPESAIMQCPWSPQASASDQSDQDAAQSQAADHIGNLQLDLRPQTIAKDMDQKPPVSMWMNQGMNKVFDFTVDEPSAVRLEVSIQPPFIPLELVLRRKRANGKLEGAVSVGEWSEGRLLLMNTEVPRGTYQLEFLQSESYHVMDGRSSADIDNLCAHITIFAEVAVASKEDINTMRSELLELPDLLAVQPFPPSINLIGWHGTTYPTTVGTQVYRFPAGTGTSALELTSKAIVRIVCEPADLSNSQIDARLMQDGNIIATSDSLGQLIATPSAGRYTVELRPHVQTSPFLVTFGIATESQMQADMRADTSGCEEQFPSLTPPGGFSPKGWTIGPLLIRLSPNMLTKLGQLATIPVSITSPSVLHMEVGSSLPLDLVRIAIQVPEGLWVGEQRGFRNSLSIEMGAGDYKVQISQPKPAPQDFNVPRCLEFTVWLAAEPINPDSSADAAPAVGAVAGNADDQKEMSAREEEAVDVATCFSSGTVPLPLDLSDPAGGSQAIGGPLDKDGRMLLRAHVLITDMHDGRKKTYLAAGGKRLMLKIGISLGGYSSFSLATQLNFGIMNAQTKATLDPVETWNTKDGWERLYILEGEGFWLIFHHPHRERSSTACLHFGLQIEVHPADDMRSMVQCDGAAVLPDEQLPQQLDLSDTQSRNAIFRVSKPHLFLRQPQQGFFRQIRFTLTKPSWVSAEVGFNFFTSHGEMDIVKDNSKRFQDPLVDSSLDFIHGAGHKLDARLILSDTLDAGDYVLRVADDHYGSQVEGSEGCFPFSFEFVVVPDQAPPTVVSVLPHPSVPIPRGADLVVTLRFSQPPRGTIQDVIGALSIGGVQAHLAGSGSVNNLAAQYARRQTNVQAAVSEGHKVWVITFLADALADMTEGQLEMATLRSNVTGRLFRFNAPRYRFGFPANAPPWGGGQESGEQEVQMAQIPDAAVGESGDSGSASSYGSISSYGSSSSSSDSAIGSVGGGSVVPEASVGAAVPEGGASAVPSVSQGSVGSAQPEGAASDMAARLGIGAARAESSSSSSSSSDDSSGGVGQARPEGSATARARRPPPPPPPTPPPPTPLPPPPPPPPVYGNIDAIVPRVQEWHPIVPSPSPPDSGSECGDGMVLNTETGICETSSASWPTGYRVMLLASTAGLAAFMFIYASPRFRRGGASDKASRFRDVGHRNAHEEQSLMSSIDLDDDML